jgi:hypothetical protein
MPPHRSVHAVLGVKSSADFHWFALPSPPVRAMAGLSTVRFWVRVVAPWTMVRTVRHPRCRSLGVDGGRSAMRVGDLGYAVPELIDAADVQTCQDVVGRV